MSADNWTICPRCRNRAEKNPSGLARLTETLREDYEFYGVEGGEVVVDYSASCGVCGLRTSFTHRHAVAEVANLRFKEDGAPVFSDGFVTRAVLLVLNTLDRADLLLTEERRRQIERETLTEAEVERLQGVVERVESILADDVTGTILVTEAPAVYDELRAALAGSSGEQ